MLTKRGKGTNINEVPMCGIPISALQTYLNKLVTEGYNVAICEQLEIAAQTNKGAIEREVVRIVTPGTIIEESLLELGAPNYLVGLAFNKSRAAICYVDLGTTEIALIEVPEEEVINQLAMVGAKEILLSENLKDKDIIRLINNQLKQKITYKINDFFDLHKNLKIILDFYNIISVKAIGNISDLQIRVLGSVIAYLSLTQKQNIPILPLPKIINYLHFMNIDVATRRNLAMFGTHSLLSMIDHTNTKAGGRLLHKFLSAPLICVDAINHRLKITEFFYNNFFITKSITIILKKIGDLERCLTRLKMNRSTPSDLLNIKFILALALQIKGEFVKNFGLSLPYYIEELISGLSFDDELYELLDQSIQETITNSVHDGGFIKQDYHPKVAELYNFINDSKLHLERLKTQYQKDSKINNLKILHNNILGLFIEINAKQNIQIKDKKFIHKQTTQSHVRYTTIELQQLESDMVNAKTLVISLEKELYAHICKNIIAKSCYLQALSNALSNLDLFTNFAYIAHKYNYTKADITNDLSFIVNQARHVMIEQVLVEDRKIFINNDCILSHDERIWLISGANMSGKSTFLRQNALIAILAQIGSFVPAEKATIGIVDKIFSRIGSSDDPLHHHSTFMVEMLQTSAILAQATNKSLIILDEIGQGTSTYDGIAIAQAIIEYIHDFLKCRCLFATHYHELHNISNHLPHLKNYTITIEELENNILFLHKIIPGFSRKSYGLHIAALAGIPSSIIIKAQAILLKFDTNN
jgi:DNA mismatch repair protein MutS